MSKGAELHEAVQELHLYLSDRIAPLMFAYSMDLLLEQPAALLAAEIRTWASQQAAAMPGVPLADLLFHAVRKVSGIGEFDLVSGRAPPCARQGAGRGHPRLLPGRGSRDPAPEPREPGPRASERGRGPRRDPAPALPPPIAATGGAAAAAVPKGLTDKVASGLRKLGLFLDRLQAKGVAVAPAEQRAEVASQFMTTAAVQSKNQEELDRHLAPLRQLGIDTAMDKVVDPAGGEPARLGRPALRLRRTRPQRGPRDPGHAADRVPGRGSIGGGQALPGAGARRHRPVQHRPSRPRGVDVRARGAARERQEGRGRVHQHAAGEGHEYLDAERLRKYGERTDLRSSLRTVMNFFMALRPEGLLRDLNGETRRERRHELLALLEAHGEPARERARHLLAASVEPGRERRPLLPDEPRLPPARHPAPGRRLHRRRGQPGHAHRGQGQPAAPRQAGHRLPGRHAPRKVRARAHHLPARVREHAAAARVRGLFARGRRDAAGPHLRGARALRHAAGLAGPGRPRPQGGGDARHAHGPPRGGRPPGPLRQQGPRRPAHRRHPGRASRGPSSAS